ncbi:MAG: LLM class F420-dependent oxidoreductase [Hyphomicrobiaceae bacterium]
MKLGINTGARGTMGTREAYLTVARLGEKLDFDFLSVSDHVVVPSQIGSTYPYSEGGKWETATPDGFSLEQLTTLAFLAGCTEKLQLVTSVTVVPHRPALLTAKILATADQLSNGRIIFGVGAGWLREEFEALQTDPYDARGKVTDEYITAFKELWSNAEPSFKGEFVNFDSILFAPKPANGKSIPIWVGGESNPALRRTAKLGDAWYPGSRNPKHRLDTPDRLADGITKMRAMAEKHGRDPATVDIAYVVLSPLEWEAQPGQDTPRRIMTGTPEQIAADMRAFKALGLTHFNTSFPASSLSEMTDAMQKFAEDVVPLVNS